MPHTLEIPDEQFRILEKAAARRGQSLRDLLGICIEALRDPLTDPRYLETEDWFRHLGASEEMISASRREAEADRVPDADS